MRFSSGSNNISLAAKKVREREREREKIKFPHRFGANKFHCSPESKNKPKFHSIQWRRSYRSRDFLPRAARTISKLDNVPPSLLSESLSGEFQRGGSQNAGEC